MKAIIALLATVLWLGFNVGAAHGDAGTVFRHPITIGDDDGGGIDDHVKWYKRLLDSGTPVRVDGLCVSACTIVLMLPPSQVCITPRSALGFHLASRGITPLPGLTAALIARYYPKAIQEWIADYVKHNGKLTTEVIYMPGADVIALGVFPACAGE